MENFTFPESMFFLLKRIFIEYITASVGTHRQRDVDVVYIKFMHTMLWFKSLGSVHFYLFLKILIPLFIKEALNC